MQESGVGGADFDVGGGRGPADEQLVRIETDRVVHATGEALVVAVGGEIDMFTVDRFRAAVAAGFDQLHDEEILVIDLTKVTLRTSVGINGIGSPHAWCSGRSLNP